MDKRLVKLLFWAVVCAILFSTSGVMVTWLKVSFTPGSQLIVRATIALIVSIAVMLLLGKSGIKADFGSLKKYDSRLAIPVFFLRPAFNFCFIMAITSENATLAVMILLFVKMLTNVVFESIKERKWPTWTEVLGYLIVTIAILIYGWGDVGILNAILLWAVLSGFLEAIRLEFIGLLKIEPDDRPKFAVVEFAGMLILVTLLFVFSGNGFLNPGLKTIAPVSIIAMGLAVIAVAINALDYYLSNNLPKSTYSAILATEVGFAGVLNFVFLGSAFGLQQQLSLLVSIVAIAVIGIAAAKRKSEKK